MDMGHVYLSDFQYTVCACVCVCVKVSEKGIQFLVLADQVVVHLYICGFEVIHIWLIRGRTG